MSSKLNKPGNRLKPTMVERVETPDNLNPALRKHSQRRKKPEMAELLEGILAGNRVALARAITLIESKKPEHQQVAQQLIEACLAPGRPSFRVGITGAPGVGKSTFIEAFGKHLVGQGHRLGVLTIDPSSQISKGSILGDKTRMTSLANREEVFIRPSPAGDSLGGVARKTHETIILCEAAGYDLILVETVGVGQSEVAVHALTDFFLLLLLPGAGDELQGIKRGIIEMADLIAINKADGERENLARRAKMEYQNALHLFPPKASGWIPPVYLCSAVTHTGIPEIWTSITEYRQKVTVSGYLQTKRKEQAEYWFYQTIEEQLRKRFYQSPMIRQAMEEVRKLVQEEKISSFQGAEQLLQLLNW